MLLARVTRRKNKPRKDHKSKGLNNLGMEREGPIHDRTLARLATATYEMCDMRTKAPTTTTPTLVARLAIELIAARARIKHAAPAAIAQAHAAHAHSTLQWRWT